MAYVHTRSRAMSSANLCLLQIGSIKSVFPYYFDMLDLIGQHPNVIHAGVGNSLTEVDAEVIMGHS